MIIDLRVYEINKAPAQRWYLEKGQGNISKSISILAVTTSCPCIVIAYWLGELTGWPKEVIDSIESLKQFYGYTNILNAPPDAPI